MTAGFAPARAPTERSRYRLFTVSVGTKPSRTPRPSPRRIVGQSGRQLEGTIMRTTVIAFIVGIALFPSAAGAQHRVGNAALGALAGAVVFGPVGAVAGAAVGYTAGHGI